MSAQIDTSALNQTTPTPAGRMVDFVPNGDVKAMPDGHEGRMVTMPEKGRVVPMPGTEGRATVPNQPEQLKRYLRTQIDAIVGDLQDNFPHDGASDADCHIDKLSLYQKVDHAVDTAFQKNNHCDTTDLAQVQLEGILGHADNVASARRRRKHEHAHHKDKKHHDHQNKHEEQQQVNVAQAPQRVLGAVINGKYFTAQNVAWMVAAGAVSAAAINNIVVADASGGLRVENANLSDVFSGQNQAASDGAEITWENVQRFCPNKLDQAKAEFANMHVHEDDEHSHAKAEEERRLAAMLQEHGLAG